MDLLKNLPDASNSQLRRNSSSCSSKSKGDLNQSKVSSSILKDSKNKSFLVKLPPSGKFSDSLSEKCGHFNRTNSNDNSMLEKISTIFNKNQNSKSGLSMYDHTSLQKTTSSTHSLSSRTKTEKNTENNFEISGSLSLPRTKNSLHVCKCDPETKKYLEDNSTLGLSVRSSNQSTFSSSSLPRTVKNKMSRESSKIKLNENELSTVC